MCTTMNIKDLDFEMMINSMLIYIGMIENYTEVPDLYRKVYESGKEAIDIMGNALCDGCRKNMIKEA